jgi:hypothetical protein
LFYWSSSWPLRWEPALAQPARQGLKARQAPQVPLDRQARLVRQVPLVRQAPLAQPVNL